MNANEQISVSFYDTLAGVDEHTVGLLNEKLEEIKQQAQFKLAIMVKEMERKDEQIHKFE